MRRRLLFVAAGLTVVLAGCAPPPAGPAPATKRQVTLQEILAISQAGRPTWSPDGRQLAFAWGLGTERDLWVVDATATRPSRPGDATVRQISPLVSRSGATVSPDWRRMAFVAKQHIWVLPLEGGRPERVTTKKGKYSAVNWSPDSSRIAFVLNQKDQDDVGVVAAAGGAVTMIANRPVDEDSPHLGAGERSLGVHSPLRELAGLRGVGERARWHRRPADREGDVRPRGGRVRVRRQ